MLVRDRKVAGEQFGRGKVLLLLRSVSAFGVRADIGISPGYLSGSAQADRRCPLGNSAAQYRYKHVTVVEEDIDPSQDQQVEWAFAHRVNAGEGGIVVFSGHFRLTT